MAELGNAALIAAGGTVVGGVIVVSAEVALPLIGFGALGPVAGSAAAAWQGSIGLVSAGSMFATL